MSKPNARLDRKAEILKLTPMKPLYGHKSGKQAQTHWIAFLKPNAGGESPK